MPLLVALDEYDGAMQAIAAHVEVALADPGYQEAALRSIRMLCARAQETVSDALKRVWLEPEPLP